MDQYITVDSIKWWITIQNGMRIVQPICPKHHLKLHPQKGDYDRYTSEAHYLKCEECEKLYVLNRPYDKEKQYIMDKADAKIFKGIRFINVDDEAIPLAEDKKSSKDNKYFVTTLLTESKSGKRLIVYAGEKGKKTKTQIFIEPDIKRLAFDQKDLHPTDVFTKVEATFEDGSVHTLRKK